MKRLKILAFFILFPLVSYCQGTTQEEYNYMKKGYWAQIDEGLDMKKGYVLGESKTIDGTYSFTFIPLVRVADKSTAGIIVKAYSNVSGSTYHYAIPLPAKNVGANGSDFPDLFTAYFNDISSLDRPMSQAFFRAYSLYAFNFFKFY